MFKFLTEFTGSRESSFWISLIFSIHPLISHAVAWIPGRNDLLLLIFTALSLLYLHRFIKGQERKNIFLNLVFFVCALLTKENSVLLPIIYLIALIILNYRTKMNIAVLIIAWLILLICYLIIRNSIIETAAISFSFSIGTIINFLAAMLIYSGKILLPIGQSILPVVQIKSIIWSSVAVLVLIWMVKKILIENMVLAFYGLLIFFLLVFIPAFFGAAAGNGDHYEHRVYASFLGAGLFFSQLRIQWQSRPVNQLLIFIFCVFWIKTFVRLNVYKGKDAFVGAGLRERPDHYLFYVQKGELLYRTKKYAEAESYFSKGILLRPDKAELYNNLGTALYAMGRYNEAAEAFSHAIEKSELKSEYILNRCYAFNKLGKKEQAMQDLSILKKCCSEMIPPALEISVMQ